MRLFKTGGYVKDVSSKDQKVTGYLSAFDFVDSVKDRVLPGAYKKTILERGPQASGRIKHLFNHSYMHLVGRFDVLNEDLKGLAFESTAADTPLGRDTVKLYEQKIITEHSIGYEIMKYFEDKETGITDLIELKLWDGSCVTWGANEFTPFTGFKSLHAYEQFKSDMMDKPTEEISVMLKEMRAKREVIEHKMDLETEGFQEALLSSADIVLSDLKPLGKSQEPTPKATPAKAVQPVVSPEVAELFKQTAMKLQSIIQLHKEGR
jgi:HK97 family phage prohead protease